MPDDSPPTDNLGIRADHLYKLTLEKRALDAKSNELKETIEKLERELMAELDALGTTALKSKTASLHINETEIPNLDDLESFQAWVTAENAQYLYHKRIRVEAWRELRQAGIEVPGITVFKKRTLSVGKR